MMDGNEHKRIREKLGMSQYELAGLLGCRQSAISGREGGGDNSRPVPEGTALLMRYMDKFGAPKDALGDET